MIDKFSPNQWIPTPILNDKIGQVQNTVNLVGGFSLIGSWSDAGYNQGSITISGLGLASPPMILVMAHLGSNDLNQPLNQIRLRVNGITSGYRWISHQLTVGAAVDQTSESSFSDAISFGSVRAVINAYDAVTISRFFKQSDGSYAMNAENFFSRVIGQGHEQILSAPLAGPIDEIEIFVVGSGSQLLTGKIEVYKYT